MKIIILGGGPCGLGAAWRLAEIGHTDWQLFEKNDYLGGLSTTFRDDHDFLWDLGGHVLFSHYEYFDNVMDSVLGKNEGWMFHKREAWIYMQNSFIPYPLQYNIHRLPKDIFFECLVGIIEAQKNGNHQIKNFGDWIEASFGVGVSKWFMRPYNYKVWGVPPEIMGYEWVGDRVATVDYKKVIKNWLYEKDNKTWGPNATFRFPLHGGTGAIWKAMGEKFSSEKVHLKTEASFVDPDKKKIFFSNGQRLSYDILLSTIPLNHLVQKMNRMNFFCNNDADDALDLNYSSTHLVGLAIEGAIPEHLKTKCWIYFPENDCPFYRVTVFSNYSPNNVPDSKKYWSVMCEVSETELKPVDKQKIVGQVIKGALDKHLLAENSRIHHTWYYLIKQSYPIPSKGRDSVLIPVLENLSSRDIYSRGRFGGWRYEVGNMDHSFMQGVECMDHILNTKREITLWEPMTVNNK